MKKTILFITFVICAVCAYSQTGLAKAPRMDTEQNISDQSLQAVSQLPVGDAYKNTPEWGKYKALSTVGRMTFGVGMTAHVWAAICIFYFQILTAPTRHTPDELNPSYENK